MFRPLTKREVNIFVLCILLVLIYIGYNTVINSLRKRISIVESSIQEEKNQLSKSLKILDKQKHYKGQYVTYLSKLRQEQNNDEVMSSILSEIQQVGGRLNLGISDLKPKKVKKEQYFNRFSVSLTIESEFLDIISFIYTLQSKPHLFKVEEFRFDKGSLRQGKILKTQLILSRILIPKNN
ncbi:MAG: type 4a pilus biogenesis protein PilO [Candidatus Omnitrophica bacterium]|nr:type 4a pilus biogenesis protein PilO [Candidatus Omnitrophota bacterium]MBU1996274.1 type 4a pilus biogenesis protein PilO [Candidatus Omnitrophota bacterium]MBU4333068.1 type 4a pilus biogenesis protein PilO [Candidatus Omnitrophota bacterium]